MSNVKAVFGRTSCPVEIGPTMAVLGKGGLNLKFWFCDPEKAHPCAEPRLLTYFASKSEQSPGCGYLKKNLPKKITKLSTGREIAHAQKRNS